MPAKSRAQFRFLQALAHGGIKKPKSIGMTADQAKEYVSHNVGANSYAKLPEYSNPSQVPKPKRFKKLF